jgi:hypothetical protein
MNRQGNRDEAMHPFANRVDGIASMTEPDAPAVKVAECTDAPTDGGRGKFRSGEVGNVSSVRGLFDEGPHGRVLSYERTTVPVDRRAGRRQTYGLEAITGKLKQSGL